jgi:hypothetical protein
MFGCRLCAFADLTRLNLLLSYHDSTIELHNKVAVVLKQCVARLGLEMIQRDQTVATISALVAHYEAYAIIVQTCFRGRAVYVKALKEAFEDFLNRSKVVALLLARYTNDALVRGSKVSEADLDRIMNNVVKLYGFLREKDVFEFEYASQLANRLLSHTSKSDHMESSMIAKLKTECGYHWSNKLENMFKDVVLSKDFYTMFAATQPAPSNPANPGMELSVTVCSAGSWPLKAAASSIMPEALRPLADAYKVIS